MSRKFNSQGHRNWFLGQKNESVINAAKLQKSIEARNLLKQGAYEEAIQLMSPLLTLGRSTRPLTILHAIAQYKFLLHKGKYADAVKFFRQCHQFIDYDGMYQEQSNPFHFSILRNISPRLRKIPTIEDLLDIFTKQELSYLNAAQKNSNSAVNIKRLATVAGKVYEQIYLEQSAVMRQIQRFIKISPFDANKTKKLSAQDHYKLIWIHYDELLFLVDKLQMTLTYLQILINHLNQYSMLFQDPAYKSMLQILANCQKHMLSHPKAFIENALVTVVEPIKSLKAHIPLPCYLNIRFKFKLLTKRALNTAAVSHHSSATLCTQSRTNPTLTSTSAAIFDQTTSRAAP